jgi:hypothetical protein
MNTLPNTLSIVAYNLYDFLLEVKKGIKQGYTFSEDNAYFPQNMLHFYTCTLVEAKTSTCTLVPVEPSAKASEPSKDTSQGVDTQEGKETQQGAIVGGSEPKKKGRPAKV